MKYDLTSTTDRKRFVKRANAMLGKQCSMVSLTDESNRTLSQNSYIHVLCRILALETGVSENYAKNVYFKQLANPDLFIIKVTDKILGQEIQTIRSTSDLSKSEMTRAINNFRHWSEDNGYYLPEANIEDDGSMTFASPEDERAFHQADIETQKAGQLIGISA